MASAAARQRRLLIAVLVLTGTFCVTELVLGFVARSEVLKADALHLFTDAMALVLSLAAMWLSERSATAEFPFGWSRAEPLAAMSNALFLLGGTAAIVKSSFGTLFGHEADHDHHGPAVGLMAIVAVAALIVNGISALLLHRGIGHGHHGHAHHGHDHHGHDHHAHGDHGHDDHAHGDDCAHDHAHDHAPKEPQERAHDHSLNLRGAWLHVMGDLLGGLVALGTAGAVHLGAPAIVDPLAGLAIAAFLVFGALRLARDAGRVLLMGAPSAIPVARVREVVGAVEGVEVVETVHSWSLGAGRYAVALKLKGKVDGVAKRVEEAVRRSFDVAHVWVHVEDAS